MENGPASASTGGNQEPAINADREPLRTQSPEQQAESQKKLHDLLAALWEQRKGILLDRLHLLEDSIANFEQTGSPESRKTGAETAHKLAGILGTFGLPRGTEMAREAEVALEQHGPLDAASILRLKVLAAELGSLIDQRSLPTSR